MSNNVDHYPEGAPAQEQSHQPGDQDAMYPTPEIIKNTHQGSGKLKDKVALISGGDSGIGRSVAVLFAREGADVAIIYLEENEDAALTKKLVEEEGRRCLNIQQNICDNKGIEQAVEQVIQQYGKINILINNAGVQYPQEDLTDISDDQLEKTFQTNIFGIFRLTRAVLPHLQAGDSIINTTSITSYQGSEHLIDYSATKGAITTFTRSLSQNLMKQKRGIRVNGVAPGPIWTPLIPSSFDADQVAKFGQDTPMGRMGQPSEVAPAYLFLASDDASYITGQVIHVNGGEMVNG